MKELFDSDAMILARNSAEYLQETNPQSDYQYQLFIKEFTDLIKYISEKKIDKNIEKVELEDNKITAKVNGKKVELLSCGKMFRGRYVKHTYPDKLKVSKTQYIVEFAIGQVGTLQKSINIK